MVVRQLGGVDVHIVVSVDALDDFPLNLVFGFLARMQRETVVRIKGGIG